MSADPPQPEMPTLFHSPARGRTVQRFGCLMAAGSFLCAMILGLLVVVVVVAWPGNWRPAVLWALGVLFVVLCLVGGWAFARRLQRRLWWSIALEDDHVLLRRGKQTATIPYSDVVLIEAASAMVSIALHMSSARLRRQGGKPPPKFALPMMIYTFSGKRVQIGLLVTDIELCFPALLSRCHCAGGITLDGTEHLPKLPEAIVPALRRMGQTRRADARLSVLASIGPLLIGTMSLVFVVVGGQPVMQRFEAWMGLLGILPGVGGLLASRRLFRRGKLLDQAAGRVEQGGGLPADTH